MAFQGANCIVPQEEMLLNVDNSVILAFCWPAPGAPPHHEVPKIVRFPKLPYKEFSSAGTASILEFLAFLGLLAASTEQFLMRHKKKRYLPWKCGPPRSKSYCATRRNATKRGQFCHFGLLLASSWGPPPHKLPKMARLPNVLAMDLSTP